VAEAVSPVRDSEPVAEPESPSAELLHDFAVVNEFCWMQLPEAAREYLTASRAQPGPCAWCGGRLHHNPLCDELRLSWQVVMPFGKHQGKRLSEIPRGYLQWLANVATVDSDLKAAAQRAMEEG
jgi:hypothetical protein